MKERKDAELIQGAERCESELVRRGVWKPWLEMGILKTEFSLGVLFVLIAGIGKYYKNVFFVVGLTIRGGSANVKMLTHFSIEIGFFDTQNTSYLTVRGLENA